MTNGEIFKLYEGLWDICSDKDLKFKVKTSFILAKNKVLLEPYYTAIIEARTKLLKQYGEETGGEEFSIPQENIESFTHDVNILWSVENNIKIEKLKLEDLGEELINADRIEKILYMIDN